MVFSPKNVTSTPLPFRSRSDDLDAPGGKHHFDPRLGSLGGEPFRYPLVGQILGNRNNRDSLSHRNRGRRLPIPHVGKGVDHALPVSMSRDDLVEAINRRRLQHGGNTSGAHPEDLGPVPPIPFEDLAGRFVDIAEISGYPPHVPARHLPPRAVEPVSQVAGEPSDTPGDAGRQQTHQPDSEPDGQVAEVLLHSMER